MQPFAWDVGAFGQTVEAFQLVDGAHANRLGRDANTKAGNCCCCRRARKGFNGRLKHMQGDPAQLIEQESS
ncbi:hypothetical protein D9M68_984230 [compost metagenome]